MPHTKMGNITATEVNNLRKITGAGMMDCKKALIEAEGDSEKAIEILRKKGQKVAANRADRLSSEGVVIAKIKSNHKKGVIVSLNCETDFVAKNQDFVKFANNLATLALETSSKEDLLKQTIDKISVEEKLIEQTGVIGEKIEIGGFEILEGDFVNGYIHAGNKIASLVSLSKNISGSEEVAKNIAMQVAAMNPIALDESSVSDDVIKKEEEIAKEQLIAEGKPKHLLDKILPGKLKRFFKDNTLIHQDYIKEPKQSVIEYARSVDKDIKITGYKRVSLS